MVLQLALATCAIVCILAIAFYVWNTSTLVCQLKSLACEYPVIAQISGKKVFKVALRSLNGREVDNTVRISISPAGMHIFHIFIFKYFGIESLLPWDAIAVEAQSPTKLLVSIVGDRGFYLTSRPSVIEALSTALKLRVDKT